VEKGTQKVIIDGAEYTVSAGEGCFYDSFCVHAYEIDSGASGYIVLGDRECFENFFKLNGNKVPPKVFKLSNFPLLENFKTIYDECSPAFKYSFFCGMVSVLLSIIAQNNGLIESKKDAGASLIINVLTYVQKNFADDLSVKTLADKFGYSRVYFSRTLNKYVKEPWSDYVNRLRVTRADALIKEGGISVINAAFSCGFSSPNTFYRAYKKVFGKSPKEKQVTK
jgi:YesN/AraC family two-component response regulator